MVVLGLQEAQPHQKLEYTLGARRTDYKLRRMSAYLCYKNCRKSLFLLRYRDLCAAPKIKTTYRNVTPATDWSWLLTRVAPVCCNPGEQHPNGSAHLPVVPTPFPAHWTEIISSRNSLLLWAFHFPQWGHSIVSKLNRWESPRRPTVSALCTNLC